MKKIFGDVIGSNHDDDDSIIKKPKLLEQPEEIPNPDHKFLTFLSTDKPIYKKGDTVYCRAVVLNAYTNKPLDGTFIKYLQYGASSGEEIVKANAQVPSLSVYAFSWVVTEEAAGGDYICKIEFEQKGFPSAERKFEVRAFQNPRLNSDLTFLKKGYGCGEEATASLKVSRAEGGKPSGAKITATSRIDGKETWKGNFTLDDEGNCLVKFKLPDDIEVGDGTLSCVIEDGGVLETASKTIPILLQSLDVKIYPEGGDFINGYECGFYVEAFTPYGDPADLKGDIIDQNGKVVGTVETKHEGRGKGKFTPTKGSAYFLKINSPSGIKKNIVFPESKSEGVSLVSTKDVYTSDKITVNVSGTKGEYKGYLYKRDTLCDKKTFNIEDQTVSLEFASVKYSGVLRVLITNSKDVPLAERLVYLSNGKTVDIKITTDYKSYSPGDRAVVKISTTCAGSPVDAVVGVTVTDESVLKSVEERKRAPRLQEMVLLESEVDHFEDAHIYLSDHENAEVAVDLLLGTQGWRRFAFIDVKKFIELKGALGERICAYHDGTDAQELFIEKKPKPEVRRNMVKRKGGAVLKERVMDLGKKKMAVPMKRQEMAPKPAPMMAPKVALAPKMAALKPKPQAPQKKMMAKPVMKDEKKKKKMKKELRDWDNDDDLLIGGIPEANGILTVREYAFTKNPLRVQGERTTFAETLYWNASIQTVKGEYAFEFDLSDSVTSYRIMLDAFTNDGILGKHDKVIESKEPFYVEAKLPVEVTVGDLLQIPVAIVNESPESLDVTLDHKLHDSLVPSKESKFNSPFTVDSKQRTKKYLELEVGKPQMGCEFNISASANAFSDSVTRKLDAVPLGFPFEIAFSGKLEKEEQFIFNIPKNFDAESVEANLKFYIKPVGQLQDALVSLLRSPSGCFEQTSSTTYPTIIAHQYFTSHEGIDPEIITKSYDLLGAGYKRLTSYECKNGGYDWFGSEPASEALTAYGTLEFIDMSKVFPVDENMLKRTKKWLYSRRDGKGGFKLNSRALDDFGAAPQDITNAYIVWSLTEGGETGLDLEIDSIYKDALSKKDAYLWGLSCASLFNAKRNKEANELAKKIAENQEQSGAVIQSKTTITCSRGKSLDVETTAVAILAWLNDTQYTSNVELAMTWLLKQCQGGRFGNTQATILALKAIVKYDTKKGGDVKDLTASFTLDGKEFSVDFEKKNEDGIVVVPFDKNLLTSGDRHIILNAKGKGSVPFSFYLKYFSDKPDNSEKCEIDLKNYLSNDVFEEGSTGEMNVEITNLSKEKQAMTLAIISVPGGLEPRHENLKELVKSGKIAFYEIKGRDVVIYLRGMKENQELKFKFDVTARIPGKFKSSASRAYLYYVDEDVKWIDGTQCTITPK